LRLAPSSVNRLAIRLRCRSRRLRLTHTDPRIRDLKWGHLSIDDQRGHSTIATVEETELPTGQIELARAIGSEVVILPRRRADDGQGVYGEATLFLAKELRAEGVNVAYLDEPKDRLFEVKKSAVIAAFVTIVLGVGSTAAWDGIKALFKRNQLDDKQMEITYTDLSLDGSGKTWTVRGCGEDVLNAIDKLREQPFRGET
jgi:hypothetical protein